MILEKLTQCTNLLMEIIAESNSGNNDELHPLHEEQIVEIHKQLCDITASVMTRAQLGEKIPDMVHEDRGEVYDD